jgi:DNA-binding HxlR family transcriptional regulator
MKQDNFHCNACPVRYTINILRGKWKMYVIYQLVQKENVRFNELHRQISGISAVVLKRTLQELQDDNIIKRVQYDEKIPKVEYSLTSFGKELIPIFKEMGKWARKTNPECFNKAN